MAQKPFTDIKLVVRASVKGHVGKPAWVAARPSLAASFVLHASTPKGRNNQYTIQKYE
jgi:hypothetical protein